MSDNSLHSILKQILQPYMNKPNIDDYKNASDYMVDLAVWETRNKPSMNNAQLIGTSFEYAEISKTSERIANDMVSLMQLLAMHDVSIDEIQAIIKVRELMTKYHFTYTQYSLLKKLENNETP